MMKRLMSWKAIVLLAAVLVAATIGMHVYFLKAGPFDAAVEQYKQQFAPGEVGDVSLCLFCRKRIRSGDEVTRYTFTIKAEVGGAKKNVESTCITRASAPPACEFSAD